VIGDRWRGLLLLGAIFACGALAGGGVVQLRATARLRELLAGPPASLEPRVKLLLLDRGLSLSAAQRERLEPLLQHYAGQARTVRQRVEPELKPLRERERDAIRAELTPEQREEYERRLVEIDRMLGRSD
jgi:CRISPR/Cas system-associated protein Csm6